MTDALNTDGDLVFKNPRWLVYLANEEAEAVAPEGEEGEEDPDKITDTNAMSIGMTATSVTVSAGGQQLDYADISWVLRGHLMDRTLPASFAQEVAVWLPDTHRKPETKTQQYENTRLFWGDYVEEVERVENRGEYLTAQAQLRPYHFGKPFKGQKWWDPVSGKEVSSGFDAVFNPRVDGKIRPNRSDLKIEGGEGYLWIHPESARSTAAQEIMSQVPKSWTLADAVQSLIDVCELGEFIEPPTPFNVQASLLEAPAINDLVLPTGRYLPFYLDALLQPRGFNWCMDYARDNNDKPRIRLFRRGYGEEVSIAYPRPRTTFTNDTATAFQYQIARRIGNAPNAITVEGDWQRREVTLPLWPAWSHHDDVTPYDSLDKENLTADKRHVFRKWVANEGGDYGDLRNDSLSADLPDFSHFFGVSTPHRRTIDEPLTYLSASNTNPSAAPIRVEISFDGGRMDSQGNWSGNWEEIKDAIAGNFLMLPDEIGVYFNSDLPPQEIYDQWTDGNGNLAVALRITGTIQGDSRLAYTAEQRGSAVNGRENKLTVAAHSQFIDQQIVDSGPYKSQIDGAANNAAAANVAEDSAAIEEYAKNLREQYETAENSCVIELLGQHTEFKIGQLVTEISGRDVSLNEASSEAESPRYPQIMGITWTDHPRPMTRIRCDRGVRFKDIPTPSRGLNKVLL